jgi:methionine-rich copper-binding protein CopC
VSSHEIHTSRLARTLVAFAAATLASAGLLLAAAPAQAHDELESTDPAADSTVEALPDHLTLTFSGVLATDAGASEVAVTDSAGTSLVDGAPVVADTVLTQQLTGTASGAITVLWKVVSSDGHPISGEYSFTVTGAPTPTPTATPTPTDAESSSPTSEPTESATPAPPADEDSGSDVWPWVLGIIIVAAIGGAVIYLLTSRARRERALAEGRSGASGAAPGDGSEPPADR